MCLQNAVAERWGNVNNHTEIAGNAERSGACEELVIQQVVHLELLVQQWNCSWRTCRLWQRTAVFERHKVIPVLPDMKNYSCNDMLHPRGPGSFSELFTKHIMESYDPGAFSEAWVGWWQMWWVITVSACYRKTEFKRMFYWRFFWFVTNYVPYTRLVINSKLNFHWLHGYKIFDDITNIGGKGTSFTAEKNSNFVQTTCTSWSGSFFEENIYTMLLSWQYQQNLTFTSYTLKVFFLNTARLSRNSQRGIQLFGDQVKSGAAAALNFWDM